MAKLGMDPAEIDALAGRLDTQVHAIRSVVDTVESLVRRAEVDWHGGSAAQFAATWHGRYRPMLLRAGDSISGLATSARKNVTEQQHVSGASRVAASGNEQAGGASWWPVISQVGAVSGTFSAILGIGKTAGKWDDVFKAVKETDPKYGGRMLSALSSVERNVSSGIKDIVKEAGMTSRQISHLEGSAKKVGNITGQVLDNKLVGRTGDVLGYVSTGVSAAQAAQDFQSGDVTNGIFDSADTVGSAMKNSKIPVVYLGGAAVATWTDVARMAESTEWDFKWTSGLDWSQGSTWTDVVLGGAWEGITKYPSHLWKDLF